MVHHFLRYQGQVMRLDVGLRVGKWKERNTEREREGEKMIAHNVVS